jgi:hypothetical protein
MKVYVNEQMVEILPGMTVKHVLIRLGLLEGIAAPKKIPQKVYDEWDNELGLDGALSEGMKIYIK